jgi:acyl-CoA thioesterase
MQYIVEVCASDHGLVDSMAEMRTWLDHRRIEPNGFRHRRQDARMIFHVDFNSEPDAIGFARAFGGRVVGGPAVALEQAAE